jgi:hypothetical protein
MLVYFNKSTVGTIYVCMYVTDVCIVWKYVCMLVYFYHSRSNVCVYECMYLCV